MNTKERLKFFCKSKNITVKSFEETIKVSNGYVNSISKGLGQDILVEIIEKFPKLNIEWLLTGKGEMLKREGLLECENCQKVEELLGTIKTMSEKLSLQVSEERKKISRIE